MVFEMNCDLKTGQFCHPMRKNLNPTQDYRVSSGLTIERRIGADGAVQFVGVSYKPRPGVTSPATMLNSCPWCGGKLRKDIDQVRYTGVVVGNAAEFENEFYTGLTNVQYTGIYGIHRQIALGDKVTILVTTERKNENQERQPRVSLDTLCEFDGVADAPSDVLTSVDRKALRAGLYRHSKQLAERLEQRGIPAPEHLLDIIRRSAPEDGEGLQDGSWQSVRVYEPGTDWAGIGRNDYWMVVPVNGNPPRSGIGSSLDEAYCNLLRWDTQKIAKPKEQAG